MALSPVDARELVARLARTARRDDDAGPVLRLEPFPVRSHVRHLEELASLNRRWVFDTAPPAAPGSGLRARFKAFVARLVLSALERYFLDERDFLANLVRLENESAERADLLLDEVRSLERAVRDLAESTRAALVSEAQRLAERDELYHRLAEARIEELEAGGGSRGHPA
jgi:hypothetical protein